MRDISNKVQHTEWITGILYLVNCTTIFIANDTKTLPHTSVCRTLVTITTCNHIDDARLMIYMAIAFRAVPLTSSQCNYSLQHAQFSLLQVSISNCKYNVSMLLSVVNVHVYTRVCLFVCVCVCVCVCVRARARAHVHEWVDACECVNVCMRVFTYLKFVYDTNSL